MYGKKQEHTQGGRQMQQERKAARQGGRHEDRQNGREGGNIDGTQTTHALFIIDVCMETQ